MRNALSILLAVKLLMLSPVLLHAQMDPEKVCRIEGEKLVFTLNLNWSEKEKEEVALLFSLDSLLLEGVYRGLSSVVVDGETWSVNKTGSGLVEVSKTMGTESEGTGRFSELMPLVDEWIRFPGREAGTGAHFGVNNFSLRNAFVYAGSLAQFYLHGFRSAKKVFLAGDFNNWSTTATPMRFRGTGWMTDLRLEPGKYAYKYVVDGKWTPDPSNLQREEGGGRSPNSLVYCTNHLFELRGYPKARRVVVTGNFLRWDPRGLAMTQTPGGWVLPVYLRDGTYSYKFLVDNQWITDPGNPSVREDAHGYLNSFLEIGEPFLFRLDGFTSAGKVILTGSFNHWDEHELVMYKTATGWQLPYVVPAGNYEYKYIVDGTWMTDPGNPFSKGDDPTRNSFIALRANHLFETSRYQDAKEVLVTGNFCGWDPRGYRMVRKEGTWSLPIFLHPGKYLYKFIVDGKWEIDPDNKLFENNEYNTYNSVLWIEPMIRQP